MALRFGPLIYSFESVDQNLDRMCCGPTRTCSRSGKRDLLDGVMVIKGTWADGSPLLAIPNYARHNRYAAASSDRRSRVRSAVWVATVDEVSGPQA